MRKLDVNFNALNRDIEQKMKIRFDDGQIYKGSSKKYNLTCLICGNKWDATYTHIINGRQGCPICRYEKMADKLRKNFNVIEINEKLKDRNIECLSKNEDYKNTKLTKLKWHCFECNNIWEATYSSVIDNGTGCFICGDKKRAIERRLKIDFKILNKELGMIRNFKFLEYQIYNGVNKKYKLKCLICNTIWEARYNNVMGKHQSGCPICANKRVGEKIRGENHYYWKGGRKHGDYPEIWYKGEIQKEIRNRDNHICQYPDCDYSDLNENSETLHVHHIDGNKFNCEYYNLISLCHSHHQIVERNDPHIWGKYFYEMINNE